MLGAAPIFNNFFSDSLFVSLLSSNAGVTFVYSIYCLVFLVGLRFLPVSIRAILNEPAVIIDRENIRFNFLTRKSYSLKNIKQMEKEPYSLRIILDSGKIIRINLSIIDQSHLVEQSLRDACEIAKACAAFELRGNRD